MGRPPLPAPGPVRALARLRGTTRPSGPHHPTGSIHLGPVPAQGSLLQVSVKLSSGDTGQVHDLRDHTLSRACLVGGVSTPVLGAQSPSGPEGRCPAVCGNGGGG